MANKKSLSGYDTCGIALCWIGAASVAFIAKDGLVAIIALASSYYLSKWIITKESY